MHQLNPENIINNPKQALAMAESGENMLWDKAHGIQLMRQIARETELNSDERMERAQKAFVFIRDMFKTFKNNLAMARLAPGSLGRKAKETEQLIKPIESIFPRMRDPAFAEKAYNLFPLIAEKYGAGVQSVTIERYGMKQGTPRLSFLKMKQDPLCTLFLREKR